MEKSDKEQAWAQWFEIPASDFDRAKQFYEQVFNIELHVMDMGTLKMGVFPHTNTGCAICYGELYQPGSQGLIVYMNANPDLQIVQDRIEEAGGKVLQEKKQISPEHGYMCLFNDTEGNRLALHSMN